jgi:tRNA/tmRNA/rRNA uracil-C5-methylase (TrmA/RlmC/RlmD family)
VLDLYAGVGLFAVAFGDAVAPGGRVTAVEQDRTSVEHARRNLRASAASVSVEGGRVDRVLLRLRGQRRLRADVVVLDPPRAGAGRRVVELVAATGARSIAYVACDPAALARDLALFAGQGYQLDRIRAFDAFPMTHHFETVAQLHRV